jgi:hypothetical protein
MSFQKCPICDGKGYYKINARFERLEDAYDDSYYPCTTCKGHKIISELNGLPPSPEIIHSYPQSKNHYQIPDLIKERLAQEENKATQVSNGNINGHNNELIC